MTVQAELLSDAWKKLGNSSWNLGSFLPPNESPVYLEPNPDTIAEVFTPSLFRKIFFKGLPTSSEVAARIKRSPKHFLKLNDESLKQFCLQLAAAVSKQHNNNVQVYSSPVKAFIGEHIWNSKGADDLMALFFAELQANGKKYLYVTIYQTSRGSGGGSVDRAQC